MALSVHHSTATVLTATVVVALMAACSGGADSTDKPTTPPGGLPAGKITGDYACSRPEADVRYAEAKQVAKSAVDENFTSSGRCTVLYFSNDDQTPIYDFYTSWATAHGYHFYTDGRAGNDASALTFQRDNCREILTVAVQSPHGLRDSGVTLPIAPSTRTVFEVTTMVAPENGKACYPPKPVPTPPPTTGSIVF